MGFTPSGTQQDLHLSDTYDAFPFAVRTGDAIVAVWRTGEQHFFDPDAHTVFARSTDEGATWSVPQVLHSPEGDDVAGCAGLVKLPDGSLLAMLQTHQGGPPRTASLWKSTDAGQVWQQQSGAPTWGTSNAFAAHLLWVGDGTSQGLLLASSYIPQSGGWTAVVSASSDGGVTWDDSYGTIAATTDVNWAEPQLTVLDDGTLLALIRTQTAGSKGIWQATSDDLGRTWSGPVQVVKGASGQPTVINHDSHLLAFVRLDVSGNQTWGWIESADQGNTWIPHADFTGTGRRMLYGGWVPLGSGDLLAVYSSEVDDSDADVHTMVFEADAEQVTVPSPSTAFLRTTMVWLACDTISGEIIDELPAPQGGQISRVIGHVTSTGLQFPTPELPPARWDQVTAPLRTMVVAVINDVPAWGGILLNPTDGSGESEGMALATPEAYLAHRYVGDLNFSGVDLSDIAAGLVNVAQVEGIGFTLDVTPTGETGDRTYAEVDGATVLERLSELMDVTNGPEFTCDIEWANADKTQVAKVLRIAPRLGATSGPIFETKGEGNATYQRSRDWSDGRGANHVVATTMGEGDARPTSDPARDETSIAVRGRWEHRFTPSTSIKHKGTLNLHAQAELARRRTGTTVWSLSSNWNAYPHYGVDWRLGSASMWDVHSDRHPAGISGAGRIIGWKLNLQTMRVTPQFEED